VTSVDRTPVSSLKERFRSRGPLLGSFVKSRDPAITEILAHAGVDFVVVDIDHSSLGLTELETIVRAADLCGTPVIVRLPAEALPFAGRVLDTGAAGIQVCDVVDVSTLERAHASATYPPIGRRSLSLSHRAARFGRVPIAEYVERSARELVLVGQIESVAGVEALPSLLASGVPVDAWFIGPLDLSASLGLPGDGEHPVVRATLDDVAEKIIAADERLGVFARDMTDARRWASHGAAMIVLGSDYSLFAHLTTDIVRSWRTYVAMAAAEGAAAVRTYLAAADGQPPPDEASASPGDR